MNPSDVASLTIAQASALIQNKKISPVELTRAVLDRIEALDPLLHAYITVTPERALDQARDAESELANGQYRGPLHGIPLGRRICTTPPVFGPRRDRKCLRTMFPVTTQR